MSEGVVARLVLCSIYFRSSMFFPPWAKLASFPNVCHHGWKFMLDLFHNSFWKVYCIFTPSFLNPHMCLIFLIFQTSSWLVLFYGVFLNFDTPIFFPSFSFLLWLFSNFPLSTSSTSLSVLFLSFYSPIVLTFLSFILFIYPFFLYLTFIFSR